MTAKEYLLSYRTLESNYHAMIEQYRTVENEMINLRSPSFDERVKTSSKSDPIGEIVCRLEDEKGKIGIKITEYNVKMLLIKNQIAQMSELDNDYYIILLLRYVMYKDWKFICNSINLSRAQANRVHGFALQAFSRKFKDFL
jgi:hypothetical protein